MLGSAHEADLQIHELMSRRVVKQRRRIRGFPQRCFYFDGFLLALWSNAPRAVCLREAPDIHDMLGIQRKISIQ